MTANVIPFAIAAASPSHNERVAQHFAALKIPVHPCRPGAEIIAGKVRKAKSPLTPHGIDDATTDPATIAAWWATWPDALVGLGLAKAGLIAIDADRHGGPDGVAAWEALCAEKGFDASAQPIVATTGGGFHNYFRAPAGWHPTDGEGELRGRGINVRGAGYTMAPNCVLPDGRSYQPVDGTPPLTLDIPEAPAWLIEMIGKARPRGDDSQTPVADQDTPAVLAWADAYLRDERPATEGAGGDNHTLLVALVLRDMGCSEAVALDLMSGEWNERCQPPWHLDELALKVENAFRYAQNRPASQSPAVDFGGVDDVPAPDYVKGSALDREREAAERPLRATPFVLGDMTALPLRPWVYGKRNIRKYMSAKFAPGGVGKSAMSIADALAMASGRPFMGQSLPAGPLRVWLINLEDPRHELQLRIGAAMMHHRVSEVDLGGRLFVDSGREQSLVIAEQTRDGARICVPVVDALVAELIARKIDVLSVDPFVSSHRVTENDNNAMDLVAKEWGRVADRANCSVELVHHTRKLNGGEVTVDSGRGGGALADAARSVLVLNRMTADEAQRAAIDDHRRYFRAFPDKANLGPPVDASDWYRLVSVTHPNGEDVGVVECWKWPDPFEDLTADDLAEVQSWVGKGPWRENSQSTDWVGHAVGQALGVDTSEKGGRAKVLSLLKTWIASGVLVVVERPDQNRKMRKFVEVGSGYPLAVKEEKR
ncbi:MAG: AAA family ATPase [Sphingobium sp.]|jgi:hypothetical protein|nr:AAA family ATPase [Sphingobium sp.]MCI1271305.1 AAA family ATPase [Sphingobium sp.]MCI2053144.1 AAA family ATPase [Sphingobium sp.]